MLAVKLFVFSNVSQCPFMMNVMDFNKHLFYFLATKKVIILSVRRISLSFKSVVASCVSSQMQPCQLQSIGR